MTDTIRDPHADKTRDALAAAHLYYLQDLTMDAIASELNTSRSSVSRLLSFARSTGLVDIQIKSPLSGITHLQNEIQNRYTVTAHIVPVPDHASEVDRLERVALSAARILGSFIDSNMTMGIAWGSTMTAMSRHLVSKPIHNAQIVQLNGAANTRTTGIVYASEILRRFGDAYSAYVQYFPVPAFFDDPATKRALWQERSTRYVLGVQATMDIALFGIGSPDADVPSHVYTSGYLDDDDVRLLREENVVGDVATIFLREDGSWRDISLNARATGPDLDTLRQVARRVCVSSGTSKLLALKGALAAGLMTDIIIDESTARALLD
ncbi:sugar-binding transcriptional regulator [Marisediminicola sp. LYQ85]|uniref:sugar-binding transcriptional regulator n=1 Tax=Marisediminicola sp. LYQ85 TaxID=3391062 RepID=UPI0039839903